MKAIVLHGINEPLILQEVETPQAGKGEVVVKIKAASFNRRDWWIQKGQYAGLKFPIILGSDGSGIVEETGEGVDNNWKGKEVVIYPCFNWGNDERFQSKNFSIVGLPENGTFAEYIKVPVENLFPKPVHLSFEEAATLPVAGVTAFRALFFKGQLHSSDKVLITGIGGGAAVFALQWALSAGAEVYVTSGSEEKINKAIEMGAKAGVNYKDKDWHEQLKSKAGSFDIIIDSSLGDGFARFVELASPGARIVFYGGTAGNIPALNGRSVFWKQITILGTTCGSPKDFADMLSFVEQHRIHPVIDAVYPFEQAEEAMCEMNAGCRKFGKTVLSW